MSRPGKRVITETETFDLKFRIFTKYNFQCMVQTDSTVICGITYHRNFNIISSPIQSLQCILYTSLIPVVYRVEEGSILFE